MRERDPLALAARARVWPSIEQLLELDLGRRGPHALAVLTRPADPGADMSIAIQPISPALGAEIGGVDLSRLGAEEFEAVHQALLAHGAVFFRDQDLKPRDLIDFASRLGPLNVHPMMKPLDGYPTVLEIVKNPEDRNNFGGSWHTDLSFLERPALASLLYAREIPPVGGDTLFANMYLAYETLSEGFKRLLANLHAVHSTRIIYTPDAQAADGTIGDSASMPRARMDEVHEEVVHPVVRTHPQTGRKALYVNCNFTIRFQDMTEAESAPLLRFLFAHLERPELTCRFRWTEGAVALWDNRCTQHYALNDYHGYRRVMQRVSIEGDRPV